MTSPLRDAAEKAGVPVVRGLEWQESNEGYAKGQWFARSIFGEYCTYMHTPSGRAWLRGPDSLGEFAGSIKEAQAVAQNHFERLGREIINPDFLSALDTARAEIERLRGETFLASAEAAEHHRDNAIKMWDEERKLRTTAEASLATMREALEPFASFAANNTDDDGWAGTQCQRERIVDWFGPSDFITARRALGGSNAE